MTKTKRPFLKPLSLSLLFVGLFMVLQAPLSHFYGSKLSKKIASLTAEAKEQVTQTAKGFVNDGKALNLLPLGAKAPEFNLQATGKKVYSLQGMAGTPFILVFYPMDFTPGCTIQLCALRDKYEQLQKQGVQVLGSNPASVGSHEAFAKVHHYPFPILADTKHTMAKAYGVSHGSGINERTVYIIDREGTVVYAKRGLPPVEELLNVVDKL